MLKPVLLLRICSGFSTRGVCLTTNSVTMSRRCGNIMPFLLRLFGTTMKHKICMFKITQLGARVIVSEIDKEPYRLSKPSGRSDNTRTNGFDVDVEKARIHAMGISWRYESV